MTVGAGGTITITCTRGGGGIACEGPPPEYPNMTVECDQTTGTYRTSCVSGFADVNGILGDGCEVDLMTDPANCGTVGTQIPADGTGHATYDCVNGAPTLTSCEVGWTDVNNSIVDGCETPGDPDPSGNTLASAMILGTLTCNGQTVSIQGSIANAADNDWYRVNTVAGTACSGFEGALTSGGTPSTYAVFDVQTDVTTVVDQVTLSVSSGFYTGGSAIYIRIHAWGDGPHGEYRLTFHL